MSERDHDDPPQFSVASRALEALGLSRAVQVLLVRVLWVGFVSFHIAWVCGYLEGPLKLTPPFPTRAQLATAEAEGNAVHVELLRNQILVMRTLECRSTGSSRAILADRLGIVIARHEKLTMRRPFVPECAVLD